jgi:hypothetical protein
MTKPQIQKQLARAGKSVQRAQLDRYLKNFTILPLGVRQRPQRFPEDTVERILSHLGISGAPSGFAPKHNGILSSKRNGRAAGIVTMKQLKKERRKSK